MGYWWRYSSVFIDESESLILGNHMLRLVRRRSARLSCTGGCLNGEDALFEEALVDKFFQVTLEALAVDCVWCPLLS